MRIVSSLNLTITTRCNMWCPDCVYGMHERAYRDEPAEYFEAIAPAFHGIERVHVTGGEPTCHPRFADLAGRFRGWFGCRVLTIETNAIRWRAVADALEGFDRIYASLYTAASWPAGAPAKGRADNSAEVAALVERFGDRVQVSPATHVPRVSLRSRPCFRATAETVAVSDGRVYPCCVGPGLAEPQPTVAAGPGWMEAVLAVRPNCKGCAFAE